MSNDGWIEGLVSTRRSVLKLNRLIVDSFILANIPAVSVSLFPTTITKDVEGIYDKPPQFTDAQLIKSIHVSLDGTIKFPETEKLDHDVTGGIRQKLEVAVEIAKLGIKVFIVKAGSEDAFE
eukprot:gene16870-22358_t